MRAKPLEAGVRAQRGVAHIDLHGEIDAFAEDALNAAYAEATIHKPDAVLLNFKDVDYINSIGIALIVGLLVQGRKSGLRLVAYGLSDHYVSHMVGQLSMSRPSGTSAIALSSSGKMLMKSVSRLIWKTST